MADEGSSSQGRIKVSLHSTVLDEDREINIHLPEGYDSTIAYPVMYVLDGGSQDESVAEKLSVLTSAGSAPAVIVVGIPNINSSTRERDLTPPFMRINNDDVNSANGKADNFIEFIDKELIPYVDKTFHTSDYRMIFGNSRGGLFVMYTMLQNPGRFNARFCFSTPFWRQDNILTLEIEKLLESTDTVNTFIYMTAGRGETDNIKNGMSKMASVLEKKAGGITSHFEYIPGATHQDNATRSTAKAIATWSRHFRHF